MIYILQYFPINCDMKECQMIYHKYHGFAELQGKVECASTRCMADRPNLSKQWTSLSQQESRKMTLNSHLHSLVAET
jgi:hypothetical protein